MAYVEKMVFEYHLVKADELKAGIETFWVSLMPQVCQKYIGYLKKVIPKVIEVDSAPGGY